MYYKKILKYIFIVIIVLITIFTVIYYAAISRAENTALKKENSGIEGTSFGIVLDYFESFFQKEGEKFINTSSVIKTQNIDKKIKSEEDISLEENYLNRKLLDECLLRAENEWDKLQKHYGEVLNNCAILDLGLNGDKLFEVEECEEQISPFKIADKDRIQKDKEYCFKRYSERQ